MSFNKLPNTVILNIFKNVRPVDLPRIRLVCRNWAEIVSDSIVLRRKYSLIVSEAILNEQHAFLQTFIHSSYNICANIRFSNVVIEPSAMVTSLWCKIGADIECISMRLMPSLQKSDIITESYQHNWMELLKYTPNLITLDIRFLVETSHVPTYSVEGASKFRLAKLEKVLLSCWNTSLNIYIMKILTKCVSRLSAIHFEGRTEMELETLYFLIESQKRSLKFLRMNNNIEKKSLQDYLSIKNLSLEVLDIYSIIMLDIDLLEALANQKNLRELFCCVNGSDILQQFSKYLSNLERLGLIIYFNPRDTTSPYPKNLVNLKSLKLLTYYYNEFSNITFETPTNCPKLEALEINSDESKRISSISLQSFINNFSNLKILKLLDYSCDSRNVAAIIDKLVHLEHLELTISRADPYFDQNAFSNISKLNKLRHLEVADYIYICDDRFFIEHLRLPALTSLHLSMQYEVYPVSDVTNRGISVLIDNCPMLENLFLENFDGITNDSLDEIGERLVHLREFRIEGEFITIEKLNELYSIIQNRIQFL